MTTITLPRDEIERALEALEAVVDAWIDDQGSDWNKRNSAEKAGATIVSLRGRLAQPEQRPEPDEAIAAHEKVGRVLTAAFAGMPDPEFKWCLEDWAKVGVALRGTPEQRNQDESKRADAYDRIDRYLRNNLDDDNYAEYSESLELVWDASPPPRQELSEEELEAEIEASDGHWYDGEFHIDGPDLMKLLRAIERKVRG